MRRYEVRVFYYAYDGRFLTDAVAGPVLRKGVGGGVRDGGEMQGLTRGPAAGLLGDSAASSNALTQGRTRGPPPPNWGHPGAPRFLLGHIREETS